MWLTLFLGSLQSRFENYVANIKFNWSDSTRNSFVLIWRLVQGNVLGFPGMFKDSHVWLQITQGNQMPGEFEFPL